MKRFLSMMLAVMLVLSSFVMVSASDFNAYPDFTVREVPENGAGRWFTFATHKDGVISAGATVKPYHRISVDVYLTEGVESASIQANDSIGGYVNECQLDLTKLNQWQTVTYDVPNGKEITELKFMSNGGKLYYNNVKVSKLYGAKLVYSEDFEDKETGTDLITSGDYKRKYAGNDDYHQFTVSENIGGNTTKVGNLYKFASNGIWSVTDENGNGIDIPEGMNIGKNDNEHIWVNMDDAKDSTHIVAEFDMYNVGDRMTSGTPLTQLAFTIGEQTTGTDTYFIFQTDDDKLPLVQLRPNFVGLGKAGDSQEAVNAKPRTWQKVVYEAERKQETDGSWTVTYSVAYGGKIYSNTIANAKVSDFGRLSMGVYSRFGGRVYIDNLKVYDASEEFYVTRYEEDFDKDTYTVGADVPEFRLNDNSADPNHATTFTVSENIGGNTTKVGNLYKYTQKKCQFAYTDAGAWDNDANANGNISVDDIDNFYLDVDGDSTYEIKVEFDLYNASNRQYQSRSIEQLIFAAGDTSTGYILDKKLPLYYMGRMGIGKDSNLNLDTNINNDVPEKTWQKVVYEAKKYVSNGSYFMDYSLTYGGETVSQTIAASDVGGSVPSFKRIYLGIHHGYGGRFYIDNIKVTSPVVTAEDLAKADTCAVPVYFANAEIEKDDLIVKAADFSEAAQSLTIYKKYGAADEIQVITALYDENDVLMDAAVNTVDTTGFNAFNDNAAELTDLVQVQAGSGYTYKVFIFDSEAGLRPLADRFKK